MKTLYFECNMGAAGDMLMASLLELIPDKQDFIQKMNHLGIPGVHLHARESVKCGITGTHVSVAVNGEHEHSLDEHTHQHTHGHEYHGHDHEHHEHEHSHTHEHHHSGMQEIEKIISELEISQHVKADVMEVYGLIAEAESHAHGKPIGQIHFHEVGTMDAVADIVGFCLLMEALSPDRVMASPVHVGSGQVRCAHGVLPVPAPATAYILQGVPVYGGAVRGELCTPTGAALLKHFVSEFGDMPVMRVSQTGYGMGSKDFEAANCVRALLGETTEKKGMIAELCCNLDDMTPEAIGFVQEQLFEAGALDVYTTAIGMKKSRPSILLSCMCRMEDRDKMLYVIFKHTTTLGIREYLCNRYALERSIRTVETEYGAVRVKRVSGLGFTREKAEYEDLARIARANDKSIQEISELLKEKL